MDPVREDPKPSQSSAIGNLVGVGYRMAPRKKGFSALIYLLVFQNPQSKNQMSECLKGSKFWSTFEGLDKIRDFNLRVGVLLRRN